MTFDYTFITEIFEQFYAFFMRIATLLTATPHDLDFAWRHGSTWTEMFFNPFNGGYTSVLLSRSTLGSILIEYLMTVGLAGTPLWACILIQASTIWLATFFVKTIVNLIGLG